MREDFMWAKTYYKLYNGSELIDDKQNVACFSFMRDYIGEYTHVYIYNILCKHTKDYHNFYLNYISDMLKLEDVEIGDNSFKFKTYPCNYKNLLVASIVRLLHEPIGTTSYSNNEGKIKEHKNFFKNLKHGKSKYRNKLKRFCDFYSRIECSRYFYTIHFLSPKDMKIKSTQDWLKTKNISGVNIFFSR